MMWDKNLASARDNLKVIVVKFSFECWGYNDDKNFPLWRTVKGCGNDLKSTWRVCQTNPIWIKILKDNNTWMPNLGIFA